MPNVNLLPVITTATTNKSYFVVSDNGLVRRFSYQNFLTQVQDSVPGANRTDQNLFTTTDVTFRSVTLKDQVPDHRLTESAHGFQTEVSALDGTAVKANSTLGVFRVGGFDGSQYIIEKSTISSAGIIVYAPQDWASSGTITTNAPSSVQFYHQPVNMQLSSQSRTNFLTVDSTQTNLSINPTTHIKIGSIASTVTTVISTSTDGSVNYTGLGRADITFVNSRISVAGIPAEDSSPINPTVTSTNILSFITGRYDTGPVNQRHLLNGDTLGQLLFSGVVQSATGTNYIKPVGMVRVHATSDYSNDTYGAGVHIRAVSSLTNQMNTILELQSEGNYYNSAFHRFANAVYDGSVITITSGTIVFNDASIQATAYQGFVNSVPANSSSSGIAGQMAYDSNYFYICVGTNQWKRIAASDF